MDIPAFVGFAASGPLDVPMAIEDVNRFHEIFGRDQMLAWDVNRGEQAYAQLPPAVRAFFRNGGRRCWIVRVSGAAKSNQFMLPGLLQSTDRNLPQAAWAQARSEGSWSDDLMVNAILSFDPLAISSMEYSSDGYTVALPLQVASPVGVGDLLRFVFSDSQTYSPAGPNALAYFPIGEVKILPPSDERPAQQTLLKGKTAYWFRPAAQSDFVGALSQLSTKLFFPGAVICTPVGDLADTAARYRGVAFIPHSAFLLKKINSYCRRARSLTESRRVPGCVCNSTL